MSKMYQYQIQKGAENRIFANARNLGNGIVESDEPLYSPYLTEIKGETVTNMVAEKPPSDTPAPPENQQNQATQTLAQPAIKGADSK